MTELQKARRRVKAIRAIRRSSELEGSRSTDATRADQVRYARGSITAAQLGDRVRRRYTVTEPGQGYRSPGNPGIWSRTGWGISSPAQHSA